MAFLGIDIGGGSVKAAAVEGGGRVLWTGHSGRYARPTRQRLLAAVAEAAAGRRGRFESVGLCVPGLLDGTKRCVARSVNVPALEGLPLEELLSGVGASPGARPLVVGDAYAAAFDLYVSRGLAGRLFVLALGTGAGAAVLDDGRPLFVDGESPGHFGQVDVSLAGEPVIGPDGGAGSLEGYVGAAALARRYGPDFFDALGALSVDEPPLRALSRAVRIAHALYRPHHVCLAGGIGVRLAPLVPSLRVAIEKDLTNIARPCWTLAAADNDFHSAAGAARLAAQGGWQ